MTTAVGASPGLEAGLRTDSIRPELQAVRALQAPKGEFTIDTRVLRNGMPR